MTWEHSSNTRRTLVVPTLECMGDCRTNQIDQRCQVLIVGQAYGQCGHWKDMVKILKACEYSIFWRQRALWANKTGLYTGGSVNSRGYEARSISSAFEVPIVGLNNSLQYFWALLIQCLWMSISTCHLTTSFLELDPRPTSLGLNESQRRSCQYLSGLPNNCLFQL